MKSYARLSAALPLFLALCVMGLPKVSMGQAPASAVEPAVDDSEFARILEYYSYDLDLPLDPRSYGEWPWRGPHTLYKVSYRSVREQRVPAYLAVPKGHEGEKMPAVLILHGWNLFWGKNEDWVQQWIPLLTAQGYTVLAPDHFLYGERKVEGGFDAMAKTGPYYYRDWMCQTVVDLRRGIDYLCSRPEVDPGRIAILGGSLGGWIGEVLAGVEPRIKTAVLTVPASEFVREQTPAFRVINSSNFYPRITAPLLMVLAGKDSPERNARDREHFKLLTVKKQLVEYEEGHFLEPQKYNADILKWLKENL